MATDPTKPHKYQLNERIRVNLPKMGLHDSPGAVHTRIELDKEGDVPTYNVIVYATNGIYRVNEEQIRLDPDHNSAAVLEVMDKAKRCKSCGSVLEFTENGQTYIFKAHTPEFCQRVMQGGVDILKKVIVEQGETIGQLQQENLELRKRLEDLSKTHIY